MKLWRTASTGTIGEQPSDNDLKVDYQVTTETTTCICLTGTNQELIVTGCHSGNIHIQKTLTFSDSRSINSAHLNLIRSIISLSSLNDEYFVSADVCGTIKVWPSYLIPKIAKQNY